MDINPFTTWTYTVWGFILSSGQLEGYVPVT